MSFIPALSTPQYPHHVEAAPLTKGMTSAPPRRFSGWFWFVFCVLVLSATTVQATLPGSLGLKWGLSLSDFRHMDFDIEAEWPMWHRATAVRLGAQTQTLAGDGFLVLIFDEDLGLVKTHWASKPIERDETGTKGLQVFDQLKATISQHYGTPQETREEPSVKLQGFHGNFYQCLQDQTCGHWESIWETPEGGILILELVGLDPGVGFVYMTHQGPNLKDTVRHAYPELYSKEHEI